MPKICKERKKRKEMPIQLRSALAISFRNDALGEKGERKKRRSANTNKKRKEGKKEGGGSVVESWKRKRGGQQTSP